MESEKQTVVMPEHVVFSEASGSSGYDNFDRNPGGTDRMHMNQPNTQQPVMNQAAGNQGMVPMMMMMPVNQGAGDQQKGMGQQPVMMMPMNQGAGDQAMGQQPMMMMMMMPMNQGAGNQGMGQQPMMMVPMNQGAGNQGMGQPMMMMAPMNQSTNQQGASMMPVSQASSSEPPPSYPAATTTALDRLPKISEAEARSALIRHANDQCCWGTNIARLLVFHEMRHEFAFHYTLQTFTETREADTEWRFTPYKGQDIDAASEGAGDMWSVVVEPPMDYRDAVKHEEIPNTASVVPCHKCSSSGNTECSTCHGNSSRCNSCAGMGVMTCDMCGGSCRLKKFQSFSSIWTSQISRRTINKTALNNSHLTEDITGPVVYEDSQNQLGPIRHFEEPEINSASDQLIKEHNNNTRGKKVFCQRHKLQAIPITRVFFMFRGIVVDFHVFGDEKKVHAPLYPQQCMCNIL